MSLPPLLCVVILCLSYSSIQATRSGSHRLHSARVEVQPRFDESEPPLNDICNIQCKSAKYRTVDGSCNNQQNPCFGKSFRTFNSILDKDYSDGVGCPRVAAPGTTPLPPVRKVSRVVHVDRNIPSPTRSDLFLSFGQFQAHDAGSAAKPFGENDTFQCPLTKNAYCRDGIEVPRGDPFWPSPSCTFYYPTSSILCNRTGVSCGCTKCKPGQLQYTNGATAFFDGSNLYGVSEKRVEELRVPGTAYLRMDGDLLARTKHAESSYFPCTTTNGCNNTCFDAGDPVTNSNILLISLYTTFFKEHNRLVDKLQPFFTDPDVLFYETRKIIGAMIQHIIYAEYLPLVLGDCIPPELKVPTIGGFTYDASIDPTVTSECNFAACRYGHSLIRGLPKLYHESLIFNIGKHFNLDLFCDKSVVSKIVGGMTEQTAMEMDRFVTTQVTDELKFPVSKSYTDLISLGLRRARDNGVPGFIKLFDFCGLSKPTNYDELKTYIDDVAVKEYRQIFGEDGMENIDLYSAILSEKPVPNCTGILGHITSCIVSDHHRRLKFGDRLWYENLGQPESLTADQILEIQKTTISRIVCSNTDLKFLQEQAFLIYGRNNPLKNCRHIIRKADIDASKWKQQA